jgi:uncharacterized membrane protein YraQ (UPF0718 family)
MKIFDSNFWIVFSLLVALAGVAWMRGGTPYLNESMGSGARLFVRFGPVIALSFLVAGLAEALMPRDWVAAALGEDSGWRGLFLATAAGIVTPAGPFVSMPLAAGLLRTGAAPAAVVTFLASWSLLAVHRLFAWEVPILGAPFALTRWGLCLLLPVAAGALTRWCLRWGAD